MRRYSLTALSIWPLSTNFLAASMTFSLLKATVFYSPLVLRITGTREYALCILERVRPYRRVGQAKARRNPVRYPRRRLTSDHVRDAQSQGQSRSSGRRRPLREQTPDEAGVEVAADEVRVVDDPAQERDIRADPLDDHL